MLTPVGEGSSLLNRVELRKDEEIELGRNAHTILGDGSFETFKYMSRKHVKVIGREDHVVVREISNAKNTCAINGKRMEYDVDLTLYPGDKLTLLSVLNFFHYLLESREEPKRVVVDVEKESGKKRTTHEAKLASPPPKTKLPRELAELTDCTICLEPMALSHAISPCGHSCCYACLIDWLEKDPKCPTCSTPATGLLPSHFADSIIHQVLKDDAKGLEEWQERVEEGKQRKREGDKWGNPKQPVVTKPDTKTASTTSNTTNSRPVAAAAVPLPVTSLARAPSIVVDLTDAPDPPVRATIVTEHGTTLGELSYATSSNARCIQCNNSIKEKCLQVSIHPFGAMLHGGVIHGACVDSYNRMRRFLDGPNSSTVIKLKDIKRFDILERKDQRYLRNLLR